MFETTLIPIADAAKRIGKSESTLRKWVREGKLTEYRESLQMEGYPRLLVSFDEVQAYLRDRDDATEEIPRPVCPPPPPPLPEIAPEPERLGFSGNFLITALVSALIILMTLGSAIALVL